VEWLHLHVGLRQRGLVLCGSLIPACGAQPQIALVNWREEAFNYLDVRLTNAYTEGMNGLARRMDRNGRGYSFPVLRAKLLMMYSAHKRAAPIPFKRSRPVPAGVCMGLGMALPSTCEEEANTAPGRFLGLDISTLAAEVAKWPEN
jgi:hypothetical protein